MKSEYKELPIGLVELDVENPRIKMYLDNYKEITAEGIALALNSSSGDGVTSFSSLKESIRVNGGIINPIIVNHTSDDRYVVIEGNTRLQIYKDFASTNSDGTWDTIRSIVYENLTEEEIHSIRLQSHLVGPRDWDPYSKAKYLDYLWDKEKLPISAIISFCGGKTAEINKLISAYRDMQAYYVPKVKALGYDVDYRDFSKYSELQNKSIIDALKISGYTKEDFTVWVIRKNIDTAQNVRQLPVILKDNNAKEEFFKTNVSKALTKLNIQTTSVDLESIDYLDLCRVLRNKLDKLSLKEATFIQTPAGEDRKNALIGLRDSIAFALQEDDEEE